ncbi:MAG TPA: hypothetical protein VFW48_07290 [Solirubrobacterales bacterium]|nr:hypothetical protein [Solirubrobacterales bacterium]
MNLPCVLRVAGLGLLCGFLLCGCGADDAPDLSGARKFDAYPVYYAGREVAGLPLEEVLGGEEWQRSPRVSSWTFIYGRCDQPATSEGGCFPPLAVQIWSICGRGFGAHPKQRPYSFRGAKATWRGDRYEIFTGRTTVVIFGNQDIAKVAARQLRNVRQAQPPPLLPPPVPGSLQGKLPCQRKPG